MEDILREILGEIKDLKQGQKELQQGQNNLSDRLQSFESQTNNRFNKIDIKLEGVEKNISLLYGKVGELVEFKIEAEPKIKKIK